LFSSIYLKKFLYSSDDLDVGRNLPLKSMLRAFEVLLRFSKFITGFRRTIFYGYSLPSIATPLFTIPLQLKVAITTTWKTFFKEHRM
jgi:hypothetical protein